MKICQTLKNLLGKKEPIKIYKHLPPVEELNFKELRLKKGWTTVQAAEKIGISVGSLSSAENSKRRLSYIMARKILTAYKV